MKRALAVVVAALVPAHLAAQGAEVESPKAPRRALMLKLSPFDQGIVRRALDLARSRLEAPGCSVVYSDFELPDGGTPQDELNRMGMDPGEFLETLVFTNGESDPVCREGWAFLTTTASSRLIRVCPRFAALQIKNPARSASFVIHESLHALGLGENPPSSRDITDRVERRCWRSGGPAYTPPAPIPRERSR
jgi:hypothetical protein